MAISSINIQPSSGNAIIHNERIFDVAYAIKKDDVNEYHRFASISETRKAIYEDYKLHHGRKLNTKATPIREAVVNLNENHKMEDLINLSEMLEKDYQMKVLHIAIHRDEGHIDKDGKENINYHAHLVFHNYDFDKHITIKRDKDVMRKLQTDVAKTLGMERGLENSKSVRLDHRQYKRAMQEVEVKTKDLTKANELLKEELKEVKKEIYNFREMQKTITALELTSDEKKELHRLNSQVKNQTATIQELNKKIEELKKDIFHPTLKKSDDTPATNLEVANHYIKQNKSLGEQIEKLKKDIFHPTLKKSDDTPATNLEVANHYIKQNKSLQEQKKVLENKVTTLEEKINSSANMSDYELLKNENESLKKENSFLKRMVDKVLIYANSKIKELINFGKTQVKQSVSFEDFSSQIMDEDMASKTADYSKMNLADILNSNKADLKEAQDNLKELLEKDKQETAAVNIRKLF